MESDSVPWWDKELGIRSEWMNWDQVRALRAQGFEVGAHTMNHVDLGDTHRRRRGGRDRESKQRLERELGDP